MENLGTVDKVYDEIDTNSQLQVGLGATPYRGYGQLDFGVDYKKSSETKDTWDSLFWGGQYSFGAMRLSSGYNTENVTGGISFGMNSLSVGLVYSSTRLPGDIGSESYNQTVFTQFGYKM